MDFTTILNRKNSAAAAAAAEAQLHQQYLQTQMNQHSPTMKAEPGAPDNAVNVYPPHPSVPMDSGLAESFFYAQASGSTPRNMAYVPGGYTGEAQLQQAPVATGSVSAEAPPKTFHCSTCNKGFARRSDLARHGRVSLCPLLSLSYQRLTVFPPGCRADSHWHSTSCLRLARLWETIYSTLGIDGPLASPHGRKASHV